MLCCNHKIAVLSYRVKVFTLLGPSRLVAYSIICTCGVCTDSQIWASSTQKSSKHECLRLEKTFQCTCTMGESALCLRRLITEWLTSMTGLQYSSPQFAKIPFPWDHTLKLSSVIQFRLLGAYHLEDGGT